MKKLNIGSLITVTLLVAVAAVGITGYSSNGRHTMTAPSAYSPKEHTTTLCLGRFLIDLPEGGKVYGGYDKFDFASIEKVQEKSLEQFNRDMDTREAELRAGKGMDDPKLFQTAERPEKDSRIFAYWKFDGPHGLSNIEGYRWIDGHQFSINDKVSRSKQDIGLKAMRGYLSNLRSRSNSEIPTEPGFCFDQGMIADPEWQEEEAFVSFELPQYPDLELSIFFYPLEGSQHDKPLLERMSGGLKTLGDLATRVHTLRKGDRQVGTFKGQEYLASGPSSGGNHSHSFIWETQGEGTYETPRIKIEMSTANRDDKGNELRSSLNDEQAVKLWDDIVGSLRIRPVGPAPAKTSLAEPSPRTPLGELAATGRACPQTGWWQCVDEGNVVGGRRQFFRAGEVMPRVTLEGEPSILQRLKGERPTHRMDTVWKLVGYDDAVQASRTLDDAPGEQPS